MIYFKTKWLHDYPAEPVLIFCELDDSRWELRKIEVYRDGRMGFASREAEYLGTGLALRQDPSVEEIAEMPGFEPEVITAEEFELKWSDAIERSIK